MTNQEINHKCVEFMGWDVVYMSDCGGDEWWRYVKKYPTLIIHRDKSNWLVKENSPDDPLDSFNPAENISDAMLVVEKMKEKGYVRFHVKKLYDTVFCGFSKNTENFMPALYQDFGDARTICLAAIKTMEGEGK